MSKPKLPVRLLTTGVLVIVAVVIVGFLYKRYVERPWTRSGQVDAHIVGIAPRVGGVVVRVAVKDNQEVKAGDLLFEIDPSDYETDVQTAKTDLGNARLTVAGLEANIVVQQAALAQARTGVESAKGGIEAAEKRVRAAEQRVNGAQAGVDAAKSNVDAAKAILLGYQQQYDRAKRLAEKGAGSVAAAQALEQAVASGKAGVKAAEAGVPQAEATLAESKASLGEAQANLVIAKVALQEAQASVNSAAAALRKSQADLGEPGDANVRVRAAQAKLVRAERHLAWTRVRAPADGRVTNLRVYVGDYAAPGQLLLAFVDAGTFTVLGYFRETQISRIEVGDRAVVTLMGRPDDKIEGEVSIIGLAINPPNIASLDGPSAIVPQVQPTFEWIRLAQRVPVRIKLTKVPDGVPLIAGTTASVAIIED
ncbi:MAG: HlyD family secretion protein [Planctomycetota bacterium]|jgi:multidrug resistance efflux pump